MRARQTGWPVAGTDSHSLLPAVEAAFAATARDLAPWPDPHPDGVVDHAEYSRVTNPERLGITSARADAWTAALVELGLTDAERATTVRWWERPGTTITRTDRLVPRVPNALPLVLARSEIGGVADAGLTIGIGDTAVLVAAIPNCGCDACDHGSDDLLIKLDQLVLAVIAGQCRHLRNGDRQITVLGDRTSAIGSFRGTEIGTILADPTGWDELTGPPWLPQDP